MSAKRLPKGIRIRLRKEKALIRKNAATQEEAKEKIKELVAKAQKTK